VVLSIPDRELLRVRMATCYPLPASEELPVDEHPHGPRHTGPPLDDAALAFRQWQGANRARRIMEWPVT
jgi:hypothetical protein